MGTTESDVVVAPDSTGKAIRNLQVTTLIGGVPTAVQMQVVVPADQYGNLPDPDSGVSLADLLLEARASRKLMQRLLHVMEGQTLLESDDDDEEDLSLGSGGDMGLNVPRVWATGGLPAKAAQWNPVRQIGDMFGRQVVLTNAMREMVGTQTTTISASTTETTIVTAAAGIYNDIVAFIISNTSAATSTRIDFRDTTAGTILFSLQSIGGAAPVGFILPVPWPQTTQNTNWTAQCATSTTDIRVTALFIKNK